MTSEMRALIIQKTLENMSSEPLEIALDAQIKLIDPQNADLAELHRNLIEEIDGYGPITSLLKNQNVTEILIDSPSEIYVEESGNLQKANLSFTNSQTLNRFIKNLLREIDRTADQRHPLVDGTLADGSRVHIALPPVTSLPVISIRRHSKLDWSLKDLSLKGMFSESLLQKLQSKINQRANILICGATGCGKTTLLRSMINEIPKSERVLTIEDTSELSLTRPNSVSLLTRISLEGLFPSINLSDLLKNALRMRPDRLVVGEMRSEEALVFLDAVSTGHTGSMSSIHGSSATQALSRLEHLVSRGALQWSMESIRKLIYEGIDLVIGVERKNGNRQIHEVVELAGLEPFGYLLEPWVI